MPSLDELSLDELASQFHDRLQSIKDRTRLEGGEWYPWRTLAAMQMLEREMHADVPELQRMIGTEPVLDVGCGDGDISFFLESLGAKVDAVDHPVTNYNRMQGVRALKQALGSSIGIHAVNLDARPNLPGTNYGLALMLGVLYHLKNPYLALETLARNARYLYMSTRIAAWTPDRQLNFGGRPMAYLVDDRELNDDPTNFWIFSEDALSRIVRRAGWSIRKQFTTGSPAADADPVHEDRDARAFLLLESALMRVQGMELGAGWYELEHGARWTGPRFSARVEAQQKRALRFVFQVPEALAIARPLTILRAKINGEPLPAAEFRGAGEHEYLAAVAAIPGGRVEIEFEVNTAANVGGDERELGVQVYFNGPPPVRFE